MPSNETPTTQDEVPAVFKEAYGAFFTFLDAYSREHKSPHELAVCRTAFAAIRAIDEPLWNQATRCLEALVVARVERVFRAAGDSRSVPTCVDDARRILALLAGR